MLLTRHLTASGPRWAADEKMLTPSFRLSQLLELSADFAAAFLESVATEEPARGPLLAPVEDDQEVWASGVTYLRSREARTEEAVTKDVYQRVYEAERPELFFKAIGRRAVGHGSPIRIRRDARWSVPEPEMTVVLNREMEVIGHVAGNDVSSRDIEGENPLYLPQAKLYDGSCALGPGIELCNAERLIDMPIALEIERAGRIEFSAATRSSAMKRTVHELASFLGRELAFDSGVLLMTGTGIVPPDSFSLRLGDRVRVRVGDMTLENEVQ